MRHLIRFARLVARGAGIAVAAVLASVAVAAELPDPTRDSGVEERVDVRRILLDVRALRVGGAPVRGLSTADFRVRVGGEDAAVEHAQWVPGATPGLEDPAADGGRLIVLFFQRELADGRAIGLLHMLRQAQRFVRTLGPDDRVAILMHDGRLRLYADFTTDHAALDRVLNGRILRKKPAVPFEPGPAPSLGAHIRPLDAKRAYDPERGLLITADALAHLPGAKTIVFFGWGLGRSYVGGVAPSRFHGAMREALARSRTSVFAIDYVPYRHAYEGTLYAAAHETGGLYVRTFPFAQRAMNTVARAISGHYELTIVRPDLPPGRYPIRITLPEHRGRVYHQDFYAD